MSKDFLSFLEYSAQDITALLDLTDRLRVAYDQRTLLGNLSGKTIALIWDAEGFRRSAGRSRLHPCPARERPMRLIKYA